MSTQPRLLQAANALLYMGPLLAGLADYGWEAVPVFAAIFVLWQMILRPGEWARAPGQGVARLGRVVIQVLLVSGCFAAGRALGGTLAVEPGFHPMLPVAVSFLAIPFSRLVWDGWKAEAPKDAPDSAGVADPRLAAAQLLSLASDQTVNDVLAEVRTTLRGPNAASCLSLVLGGLATPGEDRPILRRALVLWGTEPEVLVAGAPKGTVRAAWQVAFRDEALLRLFLPRARALIAAFPDHVADFPTVAMLRPAAPGTTDPRLAFEIEELADAVESLSPARPATSRPEPSMPGRKVAA